MEPLWFRGAESGASISTADAQTQYTAASLRPRCRFACTLIETAWRLFGKAEGNGGGSVDGWRGAGAYGDGFGGACRSATGNETVDFVAAKQFAVITQSAAASAQIRALEDDTRVEAATLALAAVRAKLKKDQKELQKLIAVAKDADGPFVKPDIVTAVNGLYPIARPLYWYTNGQPQGEVRSLLDFVLSAEGQSVVDKAGFAPIRKGQAL